jgi:hypothetical protein
MTTNFKENFYKEEKPKENTRHIIDSYLVGFKGGNRLQRGRDWSLKGGGSSTSTFLASTINYSLTPTTTNTYALGTSTYKWSDIQAVKLNGQTPLAGTKVYYVADSSGGSPTRKLTFIGGILTAET